MKDPYKTLGVSKDATADQIKSAYRKLAKKYHPDLNPGDAGAEKKFQDVGEAYALLGDAEKRRRFDAGEIDAGGQEKPKAREFYYTYADKGAGEKYNPFEENVVFESSDIFEDLFGRFRGARHSGKIRGADVSYSLKVSFLDAARGAKRRIQTPDGRTIDVTIPEGAKDHQILRLKGLGMPGTGGAPPGDALIEIQVEPHAHFTRKDDDLWLELPVTLAEALTGAKIDVPALKGTLKVTIPPDSNSGKTLRLKGKGIRNPQKGYSGDFYIKIKVTLPDKTTSALKEAVTAFEKEHPYNPRKKMGVA